jgi:hypothetical protein
VIVQLSLPAVEHVRSGVFGVWPSASFGDPEKNSNFTVVLPANFSPNWLKTVAVIECCWPGSFAALSTCPSTPPLAGSGSSQATVSVSVASFASASPTPSSLHSPPSSGVPPSLYALSPSSSIQKQMLAGPSCASDPSIVTSHVPFPAVSQNVAGGSGGGPGLPLCVS